MTNGQATPYLDMLHANVPAARVEIILGTGHFPQIDGAAQINELLGRFVGSLGTSLRCLPSVRPTHGREPHKGVAGIDFVPHSA